MVKDIIIKAGNELKKQYYNIKASQVKEKFAAAVLILKNAGGQVLNYDFSDWDHRQKGIIATNGKIDLQKLVKCN